MPSKGILTLHIWEVSGNVKTVLFQGGRRAEKIFKRLDVDDNGELDEDEFVRGCLDDTEFVKLLTGDNVTGDSKDSKLSENAFEYDEHVPKLDS